VSNTRSLNGRVPAALSADGRDHEPPGPSLPDLIGQAVGLHVANVFQQALPQLQSQPACLFCVLGAKQLIRQHEIACQQAADGGEPQPDLPEPPTVNRSVTWVNVADTIVGPAGPQAISAVVPACWDHVQVPAAPPRQTGLVAADGQPIIFRP
jgi:hypothetical protein